MKRLAIVTTHPIQYYAPVFKLLAKKSNLTVFYTLGADSAEGVYDNGFNKYIKWDLDLLDGYNCKFVENTSKKPGTHHKAGIVNPSLFDELLSFDPQAILVYGWNYVSHLDILVRFKGKTPIWFRGDSTLLDRGSKLKSILKTVYLKWVYKHVDIAFYVGRNNKAYFLKYGLTENQLIFAPHSIDNDRFANIRQGEVIELRNLLGIKPNDIVILFAGKFEDKKNPTILLDAFVEISKTNDFRNGQIHLLFVGNGSLKEEIELKAKTLKLKNFHILDFQNQTQMPAIYQLCDIFCLPSQGPGETWGLAVNEAMAAGKPIITSNKVGCAVDLIKEGENGAIFESNNLKDLVENLQFLINNPDVIKNYGERSKEIIASWDFNNQVNKILAKLYE